MSVTIGSARSSFGNTTSGDQSNGKEVSKQSYYVHKLGWFVLRCKDATKRALIAEAMEKACKNNNIGYSQGTRNTLWNNVKDKGYDPSKTTKAVNTDCSALVRLCCAYAGIVAGDFITSTEKKVLMATGQFECLTEDKYCKQDAYLMKGDILCSQKKGHTVVVLTDGRKAEYPAITPEQPTQPDAPSDARLTVTGATVNLRSGPGTQYGIVGVANKDDKLVQANTTGWLPVLVDGVVRWISEKYIKKG